MRYRRVVDTLGARFGMERWSRRFRSICLLAVTLATACRNEVAASAEQFQSFWPRFREAIVREDKTALAAMTRFPFETRGALDESPTSHWDRTRFLAEIEALLRQDAGMSAKPETLRAFVGRTVSPADDDDASARVGGLVFQRLDEEWRWTGAYVDD